MTEQRMVERVDPSAPLPDGHEIIARCAHEDEARLSAMDYLTHHSERACYLRSGVMADGSPHWDVVAYGRTPIIAALGEK